MILRDNKQRQHLKATLVTWRDLFLCSTCPFRAGTVDNKMSSDSYSSPPILRLPPGLRLKIYRILLLSEQTVRMKWLSNNPRPDCLFPAVLRTCRLIHREAMGFLYGENVFRAHCIDDRNHNAASIRRVKFLIGEEDPDYADHDASRLPEFFKTHPNLEHLVLQFGFNLLEDSDLRDNIRNLLFRSCYSSRLTVLSAFQTTRSRYNAARLREMVDSMALLQNDFPEDFKRISDNIKKHYR